MYSAFVEDLWNFDPECNFYGYYPSYWLNLGLTLFPGLSGWYLLLLSLEPLLWLCFYPCLWIWIHRPVLALYCPSGQVLTQSVTVCRIQNSITLVFKNLPELSISFKVKDKSLPLTFKGHFRASHQLYLLTCSAPATHSPGCSLNMPGMISTHSLSSSWNSSPSYFHTFLLCSDLTFSKAYSDYPI